VASYSHEKREAFLGGKRGDRGEPREAQRGAFFGEKRLIKAPLYIKDPKED